MASVEHVAMTVADLDKAIEFYSKIFGFSLLKVKEKSELGITYALLQAGKIKLELITPLNESSSGPKRIEEGFESLSSNLCENIGLNHLSIRVEDLDKICAELKDRGVEIISRIEPKEVGSRLALFKDNEGNIIELIQKP